MLINFNDFKILKNNGIITKKKAEEKAIKEYEIFNKFQKIESDFNKFNKKYLIK
jgi:hypothetical protein